MTDEVKTCFKCGESKPLTDAIKPLPCCPFCGMEPHQTIDRADEHSEWYSCQNHECPIYAVGMTWEQWNRRTPPAGWRLVPAEPTETMLEAADNVSNYEIGYDEFILYYKAMLSAAPENDDA